MGDYPPRVTKSENIYALWEKGEGDMGELAIGLYDLTAHYKALWDDYAALKAENKRLLEEIDELIAWHEGDDCPRARLEAVAKAAWRLVSSSPRDEEEGLYCVVCGTNILHTDALLKALAAAGYGEDE